MFESCAVSSIDLRECAADAETNSVGLGWLSATLYRHFNVDFLRAVGDSEWSKCVLCECRKEVLLERLTVHRRLAFTVLVYANLGDGALSLAEGVVVRAGHDLDGKWKCNRLLCFVIMSWALEHVKLEERVLTSSVLWEHSFHGVLDDLGWVLLHHIVHGCLAEVT